MAPCQEGWTLLWSPPPSPPRFKCQGMHGYMQFFFGPPSLDVVPPLWVLSHPCVGALSPFVGASVWALLIVVSYPRRVPVVVFQ